MKIVDIKATPLLLKSVKNERLTTGQLYPSLGTCLVEVETEDGLTGIGEACASAGPSGEAYMGVMAFIEKGFKPLLLGKDPTNYRSLWDEMYNSSWYVHTGIGLSALSGVDMALIDLAGKAMDVPVYKILGGCYRNKVRPYASHAFITPEGHIEGIQEAMNLIEKGFTAVKVSFSRFPNFGENLSEDIKYIKKIRDTMGYSVDLMISEFAPPRPVSKAIRMARAFEEYNLVFWEEPITRGDIEGYAALTRAVDLPIEAGEEMTNQMLKYFISKRAVDVINPDVTQIGGLSEMKRIADLAYISKIPLYPHHFWSAISAAANVHLVASMPDGDLLEYRTSYPDPSIEELLVEPLNFENGYIEVPKGAGLGVELNRKVLNKITWRG